MIRRYFEDIDTGTTIDGTSTTTTKSLEKNMIGDDHQETEGEFRDEDEVRKHKKVKITHPDDSREREEVEGGEIKESKEERKKRECDYACDFHKEAHLLKRRKWEWSLRYDSDSSSPPT